MNISGVAIACKNELLRAQYGVAVGQAVHIFTEGKRVLKGKLLGYNDEARSPFDLLLVKAFDGAKERVFKVGSACIWEAKSEWRKSDAFMRAMRSRTIGLAAT